MEQYVNQLLNMSTRIGVLMLQSGAEIYRVAEGEAGINSDTKISAGE